MSRSGYCEDLDIQELNLYRSNVARALHGKRGQAFLREMLVALDALPAPRLMADELELAGEVCAIGSVGLRRGIDMATLDPHDHERMAALFGIARAMVAEIEYENDEHWKAETHEQRFTRMRAWCEAHISQPNAAEKSDTSMMLKNPSPLKSV